MKRPDAMAVLKRAKSREVPTRTRQNGTTVTLKVMCEKEPAWAAEYIAQLEAEKELWEEALKPAVPCSCGYGNTGPDHTCLVETISGGSNERGESEE